jgi:hypothetical protein
MVDVYKWNDSSSTSTLNAAEPPAGLPELMAPSQVNNAMRAIMAAARQMYTNQLDWRPMGSAGTEQQGDEHTVSFITANSFSTGLDSSTTYIVDRRVRAVGADTGTIYGKVTAETTTTITTVTLQWDDAASMSNDSDLVISVGPDPTSVPIDDAALADIAALTFGYGEIYQETNGSSQEVADTYELLDLSLGTDQNGQSSGTTPDSTNAKVTVTNAGVYLIWFVGNFEGVEGQTPDALQLIDFQLRVNDVVATASRAARYEAGDGPSTNRRQDICLQGIASLAANDEVSVWVKESNSDPTMQFSCTSSSLSVKLLELSS